DWTFTLNNAASQYLALGETAIAYYTVTIDDGHGGTASQEVAITITGRNDAPTLVSGSVTSGIAAEDGTQNASGNILFNDVDLSDGHTATVTASSGATGLGTLSLAAVNEAVNAAGGSVGWSYTLNNAAAQYLAAGQIATATYTVAIADGQGGVLTRNVVISVTGSNDAPIVTGGSFSGALAEDGASVAAGAVQFRDVDVRDIPTASVSGSSGATTLGTFALGSLTRDGKTGDGSVGWNYTLSQSAAQYLAAGQTATATYTVSVADGRGGTVSQAVVITVTGSNDAPTITGGSFAAGMIEDTTVPATGAVQFRDVDVRDNHTASISASSGATNLGSFALGTLVQTGKGGNGSVGWSYTLNNGAAQSLAEGQTATATYTVRLSDGNGGTVLQPVVITITGTNDAPTVTGGSFAGSVAEDGTSIATGAVLFHDVDRSDGHTATVTGSSGATTLGSFQLGTLVQTGKGSNGSVGWSYTLDPEAAQALAAGQTVTATYTVTVDDGHSGTVSRDVVITIAGTNDAPVIGGQASGAVTEDTATSVSGLLTISDADAGQSSFQAQSGLAGTYGTLNINAAGDWTYFLNNSLSAVQALNAGQTLADTINILSADGTAQAISLTINGANEGCVIDFEDMPGGTVDTPIADGYRGFNWDTQSGYNLHTLDGDTYPGLDGSGYRVGAEGPGSIVAYTPYGYEPVSIYRSNGSDFLFHGVDINAAWTDMTATLSGYNNGALVGSTTISITTTAVSTLSVGWGYIDTLVIDPSVSSQIVLDDFRYALPSGDPIVLDLGGDGVHFSGLPVDFDLNADGLAEELVWAGAGDGVLVMDLDRSGAIQDGREVLSENFDGFGFGNSMEALRSLDTNVDGLVDAADLRFSDLLVWQDANSDGISQAIELLTLADLGIDYISVQETAVNDVIDGQHVFATGTFGYADGGMGDYVAVNFAAA
ncbi:MAG TPA: VCBS domain-containing protein, partial [Solimonas sp.]|nr:VCBS domain-containing protein [Solimonas sp.]